MIQSEQMQQQQKTPETKNKEGSDCKVFKAGYLLGPNITCLFVKTKIWNTFDMPTLKTLIKEATKLSQDKSPVRFYMNIDVTVFSFAIIRITVIYFVSNVDDDDVFVLIKIS